MFSAIYLKIKV